MPVDEFCALTASDAPPPCIISYFNNTPSL